MTRKITRRVIFADEPGAELDTPPSNEDPAGGTVNEDGAVWGGSRWHLTGVHSLLGCDEDAVTSVYRAACSCGWYGPKRVKRSTERGRGATVSISAQLLATEDGQYHTWEVSQRLVASTGDEHEDPRWECGSSYRRRIT